MNQRLDQQHEREAFGHHNAELQDEVERERARAPIAAVSREQDERNQAEWDRGFSGVPTPRLFANEGLANDFSVEGTRNFARDERRSAKK